jgi:magnesium chelatase subunit D
MSGTAAPPRWTAAELAAAAVAACAVAPHGVGGVRLRGPVGPARDEWLAALRRMLPDAPIRRLPAGTTVDRLLGGLDLPATLATGKPVLEPGLLAGADGGIVVATMAERLEPGIAGPLAGVMDRGTVAVERDGVAASLPARFGLVLLDEGEDDEAPPGALLERVGLHVELSSLHGEFAFDGATAADVAAARARLGRVAVSDAQRAAMVEAALQLGVPSLRAPLVALATARALAALEGLGAPSDHELELAIALVLLPRATRRPAAPPDAETPPPSEPPREPATDERPDTSADEPLADRLIEATRAALPHGVLELLARAALRGRSAGRARHGPEVRTTKHGRAVGSRRGDPRRGPRLDLLATVRTAAPWQRLRGRPMDDRSAPLRVSRDDLRVRRLVHKVGTTVIFVVDASGSSALARLNEAKGAVELLLADSYVRRDRVALVAFRGTRAELVLPPTRSLARARRALAGVPGGGGTPLATALDVTRALAIAVRRGGGSPLVVLLTDARANVRRDGAGGRPQAESEARDAARGLAGDGVPSLLVDTSARPGPFARELAAAMHATYLPLPSGDPRRVGAAVRAAVGGR